MDLSLKARHRPYVILVSAMTLDGKIASNSGDSKISTHADLVELHRMRRSADAIMIGVGTELNDDPHLTVRYVKGKSPTRIVVDSSARTPPDSKILTDNGPPVIIATSNKAPKPRVRRLRRAGANVICSGRTNVDLRSFLLRLRSAGIKRILLEGGGNLNWSMLSEGLVDEARVTIAPLILGGRKAITLVEGRGVPNTKYAIKLDLVSCRTLGQEIVLNYKVRNPE